MRSLSLVAVYSLQDLANMRGMRILVSLLAAIFFGSAVAARRMRRGLTSTRRGLASIAPAPGEILSLTVNLGAKTCGDNANDFNSMLRSKAFNNPNLAQGPQAYPFAAVIFSSQEGYSGDDALHANVMTALFIPANYIWLQTEKRQKLIKDSWSYRTRQSIWYDKDRLAAVGRPHGKFIGATTGTFTAKNFLLQTLRFLAGIDAGHSTCDVDIVSTHLPMSSADKVGKSTGLQERLDAMQTLMSWREEAQLNEPPQPVQPKQPQLPLATSSRNNAIILSGDLNFRVDTGGEQLQVAMMTSALNNNNNFPWVEPRLPSYYSCRLSTASKLRDMSDTEKVTALTKGRVIRNNNINNGNIIQNEDVDARNPIALSRDQNALAEQNRQIQTMYQNCRNGLDGYGVDPNVELSGNSFLITQNLAVYKNRRAACSFDAKAREKPLSYCDRVIYRANPVTSSCASTFRANYKTYESFNLCPQSDHNAVLAILEYSWAPPAQANFPGQAAYTSKLVDYIANLGGPGVWVKAPLETKIVNIWKVRYDSGRQSGILHVFHAVGPVTTRKRTYREATTPYPPFRDLTQERTIQLKCKRHDPNANGPQGDLVRVTWLDGNKAKGYGFVPPHDQRVDLCSNTIIGGRALTCPSYLGRGASACICVPLYESDRKTAVVSNQVQYLRLRLVNGGGRNPVDDFNDALLNARNAC